MHRTVYGRRSGSSERHPPVARKVTVSEVLSEARLQKKLSLRALAKAAGMSPIAVSRIEGRKTDDLRFASVAKLAKALGLSLDAVAARAALGGRDAGSDAGADPAVLAVLDALLRLNDRAETLAKETRDALRRLPPQTAQPRRRK
jgi:transcriptional regulator with XRE-family HTH domain